MKLYALLASHNSRRVLATAAHLEVELEIHEPDFAGGELRTPEFLALNPNGKVPTLVDGDLVLWESNAVMQYVAAQKPDTSFYPEDAKTRASIARWQFWEANNLSLGTGTLTAENVFKPFVIKVDPDPAEVAKGEELFHKFAPVLEAQLDGKRFILGEELTLADFSVGANFSFAQLGKFPLDNYPNIRAWLTQLDGVEAWKGTAPNFG